ncbi:MAG: hypothetical protein MJK04_03215 [Psychrosphaera sp.]|nr:hypothetical protein [Psychrosphaera sp.]
MSSIAQLTVNVKVTDSDRVEDNNQDHQPTAQTQPDEQAIVDRCVERVIDTLASLQAR